MKACTEYLYHVIWHNGFVCPICGHRHCYALNFPGWYQCVKCRHQTSRTTNPVMHCPHLPLKKWFWAISLVVCDKRGISALTLCDKNSVNYETAWYLLCWIRKAMEARHTQYIIEFDNSYFGVKIKGKGGRGAGNQGVFVAVGKDKAGRPDYLKMLIAPNVQISSVKKFVDKNMETGSVVETDGFRSYRKPLKTTTSIRLKISAPTVNT